MSQYTSILEARRSSLFLSPPCGSLEHPARYRQNSATSFYSTLAICNATIHDPRRCECEGRVGTSQRWRHPFRFLTFSRCCTSTAVVLSAQTSLSGPLRETNETQRPSLGNSPAAPAQYHVRALARHAVHLEGAEHDRKRRRFAVPNREVDAVHPGMRRRFARRSCVGRRRQARCAIAFVAARWLCDRRTSRRHG